MSEFLSPKSNLRPANFRDVAKKEASERRRSILYMIASYLYDINLGASASGLEKEAQLDNQYEVCENVDLDIILQEYQSYYYTKFQRHPKILRKLSETERSIKRSQARTTNTKPKAKRSEEKNADRSSNDGDNKFDFQIVSIGPNAIPKINSLINYEDINDVSLSDFDRHPQEWREMAELILKDFVPKNLGVTWNDCVGLENTIEALKEATIYPLKYPTIFKNVSSCKGILLFGPPGTGKTLLAKALATESPGKFINVTSSTFISKWRGESEKMIKVLFEIARYYAPVTIFIDEIDAIASYSDEYNHEASKRFKSELLIQMDGILSAKEPIFVLATTNFPWKLDLALLRRFERRLFVPLPNEEMRTKILDYYLNIQLENCKHVDKDNLEHLAIITKNYSGCDIKSICQEAAMIVIREKLNEIKDSRGNKTDERVRPVMMKDIKEAITKVKPCIDINLCQKHVEWNAKYGST